MTTAETTTAKSKPRRRWVQFSLRTLMVLVVVVSVGLSWFAVKMREARAQRELEQAVSDLGGVTLFDFQVDEDCHYKTFGQQAPGPAWSWPLLGVEFFANIEFVYFLRGNGTRVTDVELERLASLTHLRCLGVGNCGITDKGLEQLERLPQLELLSLSSDQISDAGLYHLRNLAKLRELSLGSERITDVGLQHLRSLKRLEHLYVESTTITAKGEKKLQKELPDCEITIIRRNRTPRNESRQIR